MAGNLRELGFLQENDVVMRRKQFHEHIPTLLMITQTSHIPSANRELSIHKGTGTSSSSRCELGPHSGPLHYSSG